MMYLNNAYVHYKIPISYSLKMVMMSVITSQARKTRNAVNITLANIHGVHGLYSIFSTKLHTIPSKAQ